MTDHKQQILDAVDAGWDDQLAFTRDLIRYPSLRGQEHTAQEFVFEALRQRGYATDQRAVEDNWLYARGGADMKAGADSSAILPAWIVIEAAIRRTAADPFLRTGP